MTTVRKSSRWYDQSSNCLARRTAHICTSVGPGSKSTSILETAIGVRHAGALPERAGMLGASSSRATPAFGAGSATERVALGCTPIPVWRPW